MLDKGQAGARCSLAAGDSPGSSTPHPAPLLPSLSSTHNSKLGGCVTHSWL